MPDSSTILILGSGSLARAVSYSLAATAKEPIQVIVAARDVAAAAEICQVSRVRAAISATPASFRAAVVDLEALVSLSSLMADISPDGILLCASTQSPWEASTRPSAWTDFLGRAGFGATLLLHLDLAEIAATAAAMAVPEALFLNATFPDAVNPALAALGLPIFAGVGNVAVLAAAVAAELDLPATSEKVAMLAHHVHLHPTSAVDDALVYIDGIPAAAEPLLRAQRRVNRHEANQATGLAAALMLISALGGTTNRLHAPGPCGLPGGYPVIVGDRRIRLALPNGMPEEEAIAANRRWASLEGIVIDGGDLAFVGETGAHIAACCPDLPKVIELKDFRAALGHISALRRRLRAAPASP